MNTNGRLLAWVAIATLSVSGCASEAPTGAANRPAVVPVQGTVTYQGKPLAGAHVSFIPQDTEAGAFAVTDEEGHFSLQTYTEGDGAIPGHYSVTITKRSQPANKAADQTDINASHAPVEVQSLIPERFSDATTSKLTAEVSATSNNVVDFALVDE